MPPRFSLPLRDPPMPGMEVELQTRISPCEAACPAGMPIQKMNSLVKDGAGEEALRFIRARNPFSAVTGRVCPHPCEAACNRANFDEGLSIRALERFASDADDTPPRAQPSTGKRIAVVGSGPAGLSCAWFSALLGHCVSLYEAGPHLGGVPRTAIPDFRLPKAIVERDIDRILALGVEVRANTALGRDVSLEALLHSHDACLIAAGAAKERTLGVPGGDRAYSAMRFLVDAKQGRRAEVGHAAVVVGGGSVAFDCAFTARRLGAAEVHVVCLEGPHEMRATAEEIEQASEEGIRVHHACAVERIDPAGNGGASLVLAEISRFVFDVTGRLSLELRPDGRCTLAADTVIAALGAQPDLDKLDPERRLRRTPRGTIEVDAGTLATSMPGVFAAGDVAAGPGTVAQAVGEGRLAAAALNRYLMGLPGEEASHPHVVRYAEMMNLDYFARQPASASMMGEASRCFQCGRCQRCGNCVADCPGYVLEMTERGPRAAYGDECWHCGNCRISCPSAAVAYEFPLSMLV